MIRARVHRSRASHERWLVSYADFITLLFGFFVVLYAFSHASRLKQKQVASAVSSNLDALGAFPAKTAPPMPGDVAPPVAVAPRTASAERVKSDLALMRKELTQQLDPEIRAHALSVQMSREGLVVSLREAGFFASGSAAPQPGAETALRKIASTLEASHYLVRVEGHTDNVPIHTAAFDSTWELSAARAPHIARLLLAFDAAPPDRISAAGYAEFHPAASNATPEGRALNRRVDVVVMPASTLDLSDAGAIAPAAAPWRRSADADTPTR